MSTIERSRKRRADHFTIIGNEASRDQRLSFRARGLLLYLMGHEPGWRITLDSLTKTTTDGRDALKTAIKELKQHGYVKISRERLPNGQLGRTIWTVSDDPNDLIDEDEEPVDNSAESPQVENPPVVVSPQVENPPVAEPPVAEPPVLRRPSGEKTIRTEDQGNGAAPATDSQREYLRDLHLHGGGESATDVEAWIDGLTAAEADIEIRDALRSLPRGRQYAGDPENPDLSERGKSTAARRMVPRQDTR